MDDTVLLPLLITAALTGLVHTLIGPDHTVPFIAMSRAGGWSLRKTMTITMLCGIAHVASSVVLGMAGLAVGAALAGLVTIEQLRGDVAGWLLLGFGIAYTVWGLRRAYRDRGQVPLPKGGEWTPWILFLIFVFGPCEPLIPLMMMPAARATAQGGTLVAGVFGFCTLATMLSIVALGYLGLSLFSHGMLQRYSHAACGAALAACGLAICLGL